MIMKITLELSYEMQTSLLWQQNSTEQDFQSSLNYRQFCFQQFNVTSPTLQRRRNTIAEDTYLPSSFPQLQYLDNHMFPAEHIHPLKTMRKCKRQNSTKANLSCMQQQQQQQYCGRFEELRSRWKLNYSQLHIISFQQY